jgi:hypothetical protein
VQGDNNRDDEYVESLDFVIVNEEGFKEEKFQSFDETA